MIKTLLAAASLSLTLSAMGADMELENFYENQKVVGKSKERQKRAARTAALAERNELIEVAKEACLDNDGAFEVKRRTVNVRKLGLTYYGKASAKISCL